MPVLPDEIRTSLPPEVQAYIAALEALIAELQARTRQTSQNSSRPPSSDPPNAPPRPARKPSGRKRGAQVGHQRHERELLPVEEVSEVIEHWPSECSSCHTSLPTDLVEIAEPERQQVWDIPPVEPTVTEHRYHRVECPACHSVVEAARPADVPTGMFGPQVIALVGLLHARYRLSVREIVALLLDIFHLTISTGSVTALCQILSAALATPYQQSQARLQGANRANVDETGWKKGGQRCWLWVAVSVGTTVFMIADRSSKALKALLGDQFDGVVSSDRFKSYLAIPAHLRQVCWAHLKRNWLAFSERDGPVGEWGQRGIVQIEKLFGLWHQFRAGTIERATLQTDMEAVQKAVRKLLEESQELPVEKARTFCQDLLALWPALWTFLVVEGVEPTNNSAERALRPAVLWRKGCFGTQSDTGNLFVARVLTVITTCRQQDRHVLTFLTDAVQAHISRQPAPDLFLSTP